MSKSGYQSIERLREVLRENSEDKINNEHYPDAASAYRNAAAMLEHELPNIIHEVFIAGAKLGARGASGTGSEPLPRCHTT